MKNAKRTNLAAYMAAIAYAVIIGFSFLFVKLTVTATHPLDVLTHRFFIGLIAVAIPFLFGWVHLRFSLSDLWRIVPLGLFSPVLFFAFQTYGLINTSSSEAGIIQATVPIFTLILASYFLKERTSLIQKLSLILSVAGVVLIFVMKGGSGLNTTNLGGISLLLFSALSFAGYSVLARPLAKKYAPMEITLITMGMGFIVFMTASLVRHTAAGTLSTFFQPLTQPAYVIALLYLGVLSSVGTTLLSSFALSRLEAFKVSVFSNLSTLISIMAGALILKEHITIYHLIGTMMIIAGVLGTNKKQMHSKTSRM
ncbi:EamA domain-containing membrane protein RarD [Fontibacillus panacisegetis]|uniref:EamA domain-containing membrane protein RarD n=1 Tax=Fontibacillus panacisegetis TaxID=670482 RepID=A0A1G7LUW9_9BACL|nr:EamA family transporter [Fontibacillus panacisegetis]SDF53176.1 EamA domain-containing membrane protein RarD [Fontibacillus panacisegetis]